MWTVYVGYPGNCFPDGGVTGTTEVGGGPSVAGGTCLYASKHNGFIDFDHVNGSTTEEANTLTMYSGW